MRSNRDTEPKAPTAPSDEAFEDFYKAITEAHLALQDPGRAAKMQAYMKSDIPHFGVPKPQSRKLTMQLAKEHFGTDPLQRIAAAEFVWNKATHRDHLYAAQDTLDIASIRGNIEVLPLAYPHDPHRPVVGLGGRSSGPFFRTLDHPPVSAY